MTWRDVSTLPKPVEQYHGHSFVPVFGKLDLFQAYLQLGVADPSRNLFQCWSTEKQDFVYGRSNALSFGNVHSVYGFVASISELINKVINEILMIPALVYIDDIIFCATPPLLEVYMDAIRRMLALAGIAVAPEKCETAPREVPIEILGIMFESHDDRVEIFLGDKKVERISKKIDETTAALDEVELEPKTDTADLFHQLEEVSGLFIHATFWRNVKRGVPLTRMVYDLISNRKTFPTRIKSKEKLQSVKLMLTAMKEEIAEQKHMIIRKSLAARKRVHIMTDASCSSDDVAFGGILFNEDGSSSAFSLHAKQNELPMNLRRASILVYELIAVKIAQVLFRKAFQDASVVAHCDNAGATYGLVKGALKCPLATSIVVDIGNTTINNEDLVYYAYINTHANPSDACTRTDMLNELAKAYDTKFDFTPQQVREVLDEIATESVIVSTKMLL